MVSGKPRSAPTIKDVAARAGVSKSLVSLALRGSPRVSEISRAAIVAAAKELGYRPNAMAQGLVRNRSNVVGTTLSDLHNPFFTQVAGGIQAASDEAGYRALFNSSYLQADREVEALDTLLQLRADGIVVVGPVVDEQTLGQIAGEVPLVVASRSSDSPDFDSVATDDVMGAGLAVDHLVALGHRDIAHISGGDGAGARSRVQGFTQRMARHRLAEHVRIVEGSYTEAGGIEGIERLLASGVPPTAICAANDQVALGVLRALSRGGLDVPGDVSVVGYDDTPLAAYEHIGLTSVRQDAPGMGRTAVALLLERLLQQRSDARHLLLKPGLTIRGTTSKPRV